MIATALSLVLLCSPLATCYCMFAYRSVAIIFWSVAHFWFYGISLLGLYLGTFILV